jgi:hypothetical protein
VAMEKRMDQILMVKMVLFILIEIIPQSPSELLTKQHEMEEKVVSIWSVLSAFEGNYNTSHLYHFFIFFKKKG